MPPVERLWQRQAERSACSCQSWLHAARLNLHNNQPDTNKTALPMDRLQTITNMPCQKHCPHWQRALQATTSQHMPPHVGARAYQIATPGGPQTLCAKLLRTAAPATAA